MIKGVLRPRLIAAVAVLSAGVGLLAYGSSASASSGTGPNLGLITPGTVKVGFMNGLMPYIGLKNGRLTGVDGQLFTHAVAPLRLKVKPQGSQFDAMIAGVQSGRLDIGIGGIAWTKQREQAGVYTDPVYYSPLVMLVRPGLNVHTVSQLKGLKIGAPTATLNLQAAQAAGADAKAYPDWASTLADLTAGRLDAASVDPLIVIDAKKNDPALKNYHVDVIDQPTKAQLAANPALSAFEEYQVAWYCSKKAKNLCAALSSQIDKMYKNGSSKKILTSWGVNAAKFLTATPAMSKERRGVDRPKNWTAPTMGH